MRLLNRHEARAALAIHEAGGVLTEQVARALALEPLRALQPRQAVVGSECPHCAMDYAVAAGEAVMCRRCGEWVATVARGAE